MKRILSVVFVLAWISACGAASQPTPTPVPTPVPTPNAVLKSQALRFVESSAKLSERLRSGITLNNLVESTSDLRGIHRILVNAGGSSFAGPVKEDADAALTALDVTIEFWKLKNAKTTGEAWFITEGDQHFGALEKILGPRAQMEERGGKRVMRPEPVLAGLLGVCAAKLEGANPAMIALAQ